jgi:3-oxoacyl-[acyl-carrier-protein] synthase II
MDMGPLKKRVVVTGLGTVNPIGNSVSDTWEGICAGKSGITHITKFDTSNLRTKIAGEVKKFDPLSFVTSKEVRRFDDFIIYALASAEMALEDAGLTINDGNADRIGTLLGSGIGGLLTIEREKEVLLKAGPKKISPFTIPGALANLASGTVAIKFGTRGPISCAVTACSAGNNAIGDAFRTIAYGFADAMITGGAEAAVSPLAIAAFNAMRAISTRNDNPAAASRPFDRDRDGFIMSDGCGIVILEELSFALNRGARIYAEVSGFGSTCDAYHIAAPPPGHPGAVRAMELALREAGMDPFDIDYINAHGTSTPLNDLYEIEAIRKVFGDHCRKVAVSSTKSMTGHLLGAAGGLEAIISIKSIEDGIIPPTINLNNPDFECDLDLIPHKMRKQDIRAAMSNTFGFGGANAVLVFKKFEE